MITKAEDFKAEWTCGHIGGAVCAECYRLLAAKAHELAREIDELKQRIEAFQQQRRILTENDDHD